MKTNELIEMIRGALANDADELRRRRALNACDQLLVVLNAEPGQPLPVPPAPHVAAQVATAPTVAATPPAPSFSPATQMLDALIAKLKAELPSENQPEPPRRDDLRIPFVRIPGVGK